MKPKGHHEVKRTKSGFRWRGGPKMNRKSRDVRRPTPMTSTCLLRDHNWLSEDVLVVYLNLPGLVADYWYGLECFIQDTGSVLANRQERPNYNNLALLTHMVLLNTDKCWRTWSNSPWAWHLRAVSEAGRATAKLLTPIGWWSVRNHVLNTGCNRRAVVKSVSWIEVLAQRPKSTICSIYMCSSFKISKLYHGHSTINAGNGLHKLQKWSNTTIAAIVAVKATCGKRS